MYVSTFYKWIQKEMEPKQNFLEFHKNILNSWKGRTHVGKNNMHKLENLNHILISSQLHVEAILSPLYKWIHK